MLKCCVCAVADKKYKCPKCYQPYCSVNCYKLHKDSVECEQAVVNNEKAKEEISQEKADEEPTIYEPFTTEDTVPPEKLQLLRKSEELKKLLCNPHLRNFLSEIDTSRNPRKAMEYAMQEPLFLEFANECLKIVEPESPSSNFK